MAERSLTTALVEIKSCVRRVEAEILTWNSQEYFKALDATSIIHFVSISVASVPQSKSYIVIELSADRAGDESLRILATAMHDFFVRMLTAAGIDAPGDMENFLVSKELKIGLGPAMRCGLLFDGSPAMTVERIRREDCLAAWLETTLESLRGEDSPAQKLQAATRKLWDDGRFKWAFVPQPAPFLSGAPPRKTVAARAGVGAGFAVKFLVWPTFVVPVLLVLALLSPPVGDFFTHVWLLVLFSLLIAAGYAFAIFSMQKVEKFPEAISTALVFLAMLWPALGDFWLHFWRLFGVFALMAAAYAFTIYVMQETETIPESKPDQQQLEDILQRENQSNQNVLLTTSVLKPGILWRVNLHLALFAVQTALPLLWAPGRLGGINDIHFARWLLLPNSKILIFRSHYDGSWLNYLEDFVLRAPQGVTVIWSNTIGFPRTRFFALKGARDGPRFLQWARTQTRSAPFWYSAYPGLSMQRIRLNARIARAVATGEPDETILGWLTSLGDAYGDDF